MGSRANSSLIGPRVSNANALPHVGGGAFKVRLMLSKVTKLLGLLLILPILVGAEQLPIKVYTSTDGLPSTCVLSIVRDSRGFLWFCTRDGLSRFDGQRFFTYTMEHGLPNPTINHLLETRSGVYWVATNGGGVCRFNPGGDRLFTVFPVGGELLTNRVNILYEDREGKVWAGTDRGLFRLEGDPAQEGFRQIEMSVLPSTANAVYSIVGDQEGSLWVGTQLGLLRLLPDSRIIHCAIHPSQRGDFVRALLEDQEGRLWVGHPEGLFVLKPEPASRLRSTDCGSGNLLSRSTSRNPKSEQRNPTSIRLPEIAGDSRRFTVLDGLPHSSVTGLHLSPDGRIWTATVGGLALFDGQRFQPYTSANGMLDYVIGLAEDRDGNLWISSSSCGVIKVALNGLTTFNEADGLSQASDTLSSPSSLLVHAIFEDVAGNLNVVTGRFVINRFDGKRFASVQPHLPDDAEVAAFASQVGFLDRTGSWWMLTSSGLFRFSSENRIEELAHKRASAIYTTRDWLGGNQPWRLFEDSRGDIWIAARGTQGGLARWERATEKWHSYPRPGGLSPANAPSGFCEDRAGSVWIGFNQRGLLRYTAGRFRLFTEDDGLAAEGISGLYCDRAGRVWIATSQSGLGRIDNPLADQPEFIFYSTSQGLSSNNVRCITEDEWGRIYIGTARGVDQIDPDTERVRHYTTDDGLANDFVTVAFRDRSGVLWFGTRRGLSRFVPKPESAQTSPPPIWIGSLRIAGDSRQISELGETEVSVLELTPGENQIHIEFFSIGFRAGETLRYQYKLEGADRDWSTPSSERTVNYASLEPGGYRFLVRAVTTDGTTSTKPAVIAYRILPPIWQRWWFLALAAAIVGLGIYALYRYRVARLVELERVRTRIATDLHDDIGASLSRMAIVSEVVKQQIGPIDHRSSERLSEIADTARGLIDSMSDIVWSIDPRQNDFRSLAVHVRQFASDVLETQGVKFSFQVPPELEKVRVAPDQRRHLFLIFKEAINNVARHSDCSSVSLVISVSRGLLLAEMVDDGRGFEFVETGEVAANGRAGNGLKNMQERAAQLGGSLRVQSTPGMGTNLTLTIPLKELGA